MLNDQNKRVFFRTFGCQMNVHDSQRMAEILAPHGYGLAEAPEQADLIVINTCSVREKARQKVLSTVGRYSKLKDRRPELLLAVAGCVAQQDGQRLLDEAPAVDLVFSPDHIAGLPGLLERARRERRVQIGFTEVEDYTFLQAAPGVAGAPGPTALVTIQKGCDNFCAYCIVPHVRGPEVSRPADEIVAEVERLAAAGCKEVTLIGQNVNSYRGLNGDALDFVELLRRVDTVEGIARLRFTTSHPKDFHEELARCFGELSTLCPWLHLPVQSGSDRVLRAMNRGYDRQRILELVARVRQHAPQIAIGTDLIVGFPGETEQDFAQTLDLVQRVGFDYSFSFKYSVRPMTPAAQNLPDDVPEEEKASRLRRLQQTQDRLGRAHLARLEGQRLEVLVEGPSRRGGEQLCGRAPGNQVVNFGAERGEEVRVGQTVWVRVERAGRHSLTGALVPGPVARRPGEETNDDAG